MGRLTYMALGAVIVALPAMAGAQMPGTYVSDARSHCKLWWATSEEQYVAQSAKWSGSCVGGMVNGRGTFEVVEVLQAAGQPPFYLTWTGEGDFAAGKLAGRAFMNSTNGKGRTVRMEGEFRDGVLNGRGIRTGTDGSLSFREEGEWRDGKKNGWNVLDRDTNREGIAMHYHYEGEWKNDKHDGRGIEVYSARGCSRQHRYEGGFKDNAHDGPATLKTLDGKTYTGVFRNDTLGQLTQDDLWIFEDDFKKVCS